MRTLSLGLALLLGAFATPASAQGGRALDVPAAGIWTHAASKIGLPAELDGSSRTSVADNGTGELDVMTQYRSADGLITTVYLFRSQLPVVPLWFDRASTVLQEVQKRAGGVRSVAEPVSFALPGDTAPGAMRAVYAYSGGQLKSTGLAIAQRNGWLVKLRISSPTLTPEQLDAKLASTLAAIRWPESAAPAAGVEPIQPCAGKLEFHRAKMVKPDMSQALLGSLVAMAGASKAPDPSVRYCREADEGMLYGVYRPIGTTGAYLMAIADSGRLLSVSPGIRLDPKDKPSVGVTLLDLNRSAVYPGFDRLPAPKQALDLIRTTQPISSAEVGTATININSGSIK